MKSVLPILSVVLAIIVVWYGATVALNAQWTRDQAARAGAEVSFVDVVRDTMAQARPKLPAPHQVAVELYKSTWAEEVFGRRGIVATGTLSNRSLIYHGWVTLSATMLGFAFGTGLGILLAIGIVHSKAMDMSFMPWAIASQTVPILAIAPMVIVVLASIGIKGLIPKAIIAAYLSFFPVLVGMVKGFRAPDAMQLDLLKTYNASRARTFLQLRLPSSVPYLFASLKVGIAAALVGTIVGELPAGASAGLGARLLSGSYYGQTIQIWAALLAAATLAAGLVMIVGAVERVVLRRMGMRT